VHIDIEQLQDVAIVTVHEPRLDALVASELRNRLMALADGGCSRLALDVSRVAFMDSSGLGVLVALLRRLGRPQALALWGPTPAVERMLRLARMDRILTLVPDREAALESLRAG
jgi:anti-sigma B factor antagonist